MQKDGNGGTDVEVETPTCSASASPKSAICGPLRRKAANEHATTSRQNRSEVMLAPTGVVAPVTLIYAHVSLWRA